MKPTHATQLASCLLAWAEGVQGAPLGFVSDRRHAEFAGGSEIGHRVLVQLTWQPEAGGR